MNEASFKLSYRIIYYFYKRDIIHPSVVISVLYKLGILVYIQVHLSLLLLGTKSDITYKAWYDLIKNNFEAHYWIAAKPTEGEVRPDLINRRGIYKDTLNATSSWTDYQLRPNFPVAICMVSWYGMCMVSWYGMV